MEPAEILVYFVNGFLTLVLIVSGILVLIRDPKDKLNKYYFLFNLFLSLGFLTNIVQRLLDLVLWNSFLNRITAAVITFSFIFLLLFNLILVYEARFTQKYAWILICIWAIVCSSLLFVFWENGTYWHVDLVYQSGVPYWSTDYVIFMLVLNQGIYIAIYIILIIAKQRFNPNKLRAKHFTRNLGIIFCNWFFIGNILNNWMYFRDNVTWFSTFLYYSTYLALPGLILFYVSTTRNK